MRAIEQAVQRGVEAVELVAARVAQHARLQAGHGIQQGQRRDFAAGEHEVAQADLINDVTVNKALVNAFVAPAYEDGHGRVRRLRRARLHRR